MIIDIRQITYKQYSEFKAADDAYRKNAQEELAGAFLMQAVNAIVKLDEDTPLYASEDLPADFTYKIGDEISVHATYIHIVNLINAYKPEPWNEIQLGTQKYYLSSMTIEGLIRPNAQEAITALEFSRQLALVEQDDIDGNISFNMGLRTFAILVRKKDEFLPENRKDLLAFVTKRAELFEELSMDVVLDVNAFFFQQLTKSLTTLSIASSSTRPKKLIRRPKRGQQKKEGPYFTKRLVGN